MNYEFERLGRMLAAIQSLPRIETDTDRDSFKNGHPGFRVLPHANVVLPLCTSPRRGEDISRRNFRTFSQTSASLTEIGNLLSFLQCAATGPNLKLRYASAGGLYPVQTYVCLHPVRSANSTDASLPLGAYYYNPERHALTLLRKEFSLDRSIHAAVNRPVFDQASFSLFLIADLQAIAPAYGVDSLRFSTLEAGLMAQLLESVAPENGIALCHIGTVDEDAVKRTFSLGRLHLFLHSFLGGLLPP